MGKSEEKIIGMPKAIRLCGKTIAIEIVDKLRDSQNNNLFGEACYSENKIKINCEHQSHFDVTVLHEIVHFLDFVHNNNRLNESNVERLAWAMYDLIRNNPDLIEYIQASC